MNQKQQVLDTWDHLQFKKKELKARITLYTGKSPSKQRDSGI